MALRTHYLPSRRLEKRLWLSRWTNVSRWREAISTYFFLPVQRKKWLGRSYLINILSRWMAIRSHNLPSGRKKKRFCRSRWSDVSGRWKAMQTHFLHPGHQKKRIVRNRLSDVLTRWMCLSTHIFPSERLKNDFCEVDEAMFQGVERQCELILCFLDIEKASWTKSLKWCFM
jgi:hypothetical protein